MSHQKDQNITLPLIDIKTSSENIRSLRTYFDKGFRNGQYTLDDAERILEILNNLTKVNDNLDLYQKFIVMTSKKDPTNKQLVTDVKDYVNSSH